jgi:hypothetical protein
MNKDFLVAKHVQWNTNEYRLDDVHRHSEKRPTEKAEG